MTMKDDGKERRSFLKYLGMTFLGLGSWPFLKRTENRLGQGVFASLFLKDTSTVQIPRGYFDPQSQLYLDAETNKPMFIEEDQEKGKETQEEKKVEVLSDKEFFERFGNEEFISLKDFQKHLKSIKPKTRGAGSTQCIVTTDKVTNCCPLYSDSYPDDIADDWHQ